MVTDAEQSVFQRVPAISAKIWPLRGSDFEGLERLAPLNTNIDPLAACIIERKSPNWRITSPSLDSMPKKKAP